MINLIFKIQNSKFNFAFCFSAFCFLQLSLFSQSSPIVILHTNDTHSRIEPYNDPDYGDVGGILRRNTFITETRSQYPNTLVVDAGDFSQGTPYFNLFKGFPEIELMNMLGYDVVALGNHEFDNGLKALAKRLKIADFKIVCANYQFKNKPLTKLIKPYTIIEIEEKKIGFFGLLRDLNRLVLPIYYKETKFLAPIAAAQKMVDILKNNEECNLIICLSHLGIKEQFSGDITDKDLAAQVSGIDFIIGGHSHELLKEPEIVNGTKILQARFNGSCVGKVVIKD
jgi:5'-nucleotidase